MSEAAPMRELIVVDGFNVLHAGVLRGRDRDGWWRPEARARLIEALAPLAGGSAEVRVVFDARGDGGERDDARPAGMTNVAEGAGAGAAFDDDGRSAGATNVADRAGAGAAASLAPADDDGRSTGATNVAADAESGGGIHRLSEATNVAGGETRTTSPGRDAHRAKRRGPAAGRRPAAFRSPEGPGGPDDDDHSAGVTNVAEGRSVADRAGRIRVVLAPQADDRIVEEVLREAARRPVTAVTSDRELALRVREAGGDVVGAGAFLARLAAAGPG